jgi:hypothetical protein
MTEPTTPAPAPIAAPTEAAPFTQAALDAALPPTPATEPATTEAPPTATVPAAPKPAPALADKVQAAEEASRAIIAKRQAQRAVHADAAARARYLEHQVATERAARERAELAAKRVETDPLAVMRERGITDRMVAQAHVDDHSPEGRLAKAEARAAALEQRLDEQERRTQSATQAAQVQSAREAFVRQAMDAKEGEAAVYPHLAAKARLAPHLVLAEAQAIIEQTVAAQGKLPSNKDVYEYQEWLYAKSAEEAAKLAGAGAPLEAPKAVQAPAAPAPKRTGARTLSSRSTAPASVPKSFNEISPRDQLSVMAAQLAAMTPHT